MSATQYIEDLMKREGGYANNPKDSGKETKYGITIGTARAYDYTGPMRDLPYSTAQNIYLRRYWVEPNFHKINEIYPALAESLLDFGVLAGQRTAAAQLQRVLNVLNRQQKDYADLEDDGRIGTITLAALRAYLQKRGREGGAVLFGMVAARQSVYLQELAERRPKDEEFEYGWQRNRALDPFISGKDFWPA
ncbi:glycoside hydrolase family 108 protein [Comamonas testosteroni]|uniref:glycoside hydrolase family 108 protein n=1 Tax=Comamonas testosteroni TaxID=285 RepID=UPI0026F23821|nr:glycosyl hydrolase 108 family protein [Comamonas testosteroni]